MESFSIFHNISIKATKEDVFRMVSVPEFIDEWWTNSCSGAPQLEAEYTFYFSDKYTWKGKISKFIPNKELEFLMTKADEDWTGTKIGFELTEIEGITAMSFYHTGWKEDNQHFHQTSCCWNIYLEILKNYLEKGLRIPYDNRN